MEFLDKTLYISLIVSIGLTLILYMYMRIYDRENKERDVFCLKIFILSFSVVYVSMYIISNRNTNPVDNIYKTDPDF
jgi:hypothetical protein